MNVEREIEKKRDRERKKEGYRKRKWTRGVSIERENGKWEREGEERDPAA